MNCRPRSGSVSKDGFTLLELMTVIIVITILSLMAYQSFGYLRARAERAKCESNLRSLFVAGSSYITDQGQWPQIPVDELEDPAYADAWVDAFKNYGIARINWICPTIQKLLNNPPYDGDDARLDYIPAPFGEGPRTAFEWPNHPWFMERGDVHGDGNLLILTNGNIRSLAEVKKDPQTVVMP